MDRTTVNRAPASPTENIEDSSHYFTSNLLEQKYATPSNFAIGWELNISRKIFSETFNVSSREGLRFLGDGFSSRRLHNDLDREEYLLGLQAL